MALLAYSRGLVPTAKGGSATCLVSGSEQPDTDMPNYIYQLTPVYLFPHLRRPLLRLRDDLSLTVTTSTARIPVLRRTWNIFRAIPERMASISVPSLGARRQMVPVLAAHLKGNIRPKTILLYHTFIYCCGGRCTLSFT